MCYRGTYQTFGHCICKLTVDQSFHQVQNLRSGTDSAILNKVNISTFEFSDDTQNRSKSDEQVESLSDDEDAAFVPFEY